jgi:leucyl aminopeptidase (aminopeptidase T)
MTNSPHDSKVAAQSEMGERSRTVATANSEGVLRDASDHLLHHCGSLRPGETVVIVHDEATRRIGELLAGDAARTTEDIRRFEIPHLQQHGQEPPGDVAEAMRKAQLVVGLTSLSMAHTRARQRASEAGARYLSLADYSIELLEHPAVRVDFRSRFPVARAVADRFTEGRIARVSTSLGTDVRLEIAGRTGNCCPGFVEEPGDLGSPPDIESNVSPLEAGSEGVVVVDGSVPYPGIGLLESPVVLFVEGGRIGRFDGDRAVVEKLESLFREIGSSKAYVLAECGVGLNPEAALTGHMLTDEGTNGTMHFGFGSNATVGGQNDVSFHLDFVFRNATLEIDGCPILEGGEVMV